MGKVSSTKKNTDESVKDQGYVGCIFDWKDIFHHEFTTWSDDKQMYQEVLARLRDAVSRKKSELWENHTWMLHHNAPTHSSLIRNLEKHQTYVVSFTLLSGLSPGRLVSQT